MKEGLQNIISVASRRTGNVSFEAASECAEAAAEAVLTKLAADTLLWQDMGNFLDFAEQEIADGNKNSALIKMRRRVQALHTALLPFQPSQEDSNGQG